MAVDFDAKLASLAAEILRDAVQVYDRGDIERWLAGCVPAVAPARVAMFPGSWDMTASFPVIGHAQGSAAEVSLKTVFGLPAALPAVRLPSSAELARQARSAPLMARLRALSAWLGEDGRLVDSADKLSDADAARAVGVLGIDRDYLPYLWEYALTSGWLELRDKPAGGRTRVVHGQTARRWADGDDSGALRVWAVIFASVLAAALDVAVLADADSARKLNFLGQGVAAGLLLFLARRPGLSRAQVGELVMDGAVGAPASAGALRAWHAWVRTHGDPARFLLRDLADLGAVTLPETGAGVVGLTPLALGALREQLIRDGVEIPVVPANPAQMSAADLVTTAAGGTDAEFATESGAWVASRGQERAARELLAFAASAGAQQRLVAVNVTRRIGKAADLAWRDAMQRPELRGYARIALSVLAAELPGSTLPLVLEPVPDDLTWVATDLLALACGDDEPDPKQVAAQFREAVPPGQESWIFDLMSRGSHPDVVRVLTVLGRHHPDRRVARDAKRAAQTLARSRPSARAAARASARAERIPVRFGDH